MSRVVIWKEDGKGKGYSGGEAALAGAVAILLTAAVSSVITFFSVKKTQKENKKEG